MSTESKDGAEVLAEVIREQMAEASATDTGVTEVGMVEVEDQGLGEPSHTVEVEFNGDRYLITVARIDPVDVAPVVRAEPVVPADDQEYLRLMPIMEFLRDAEDEIKESFLDAFGTRDTGYAPDLDNTLTAEAFLPIEAHEVAMIQVIGGHWFEDKVLAWSGFDPSGHEHLWVRAELVG